ncbi:DUF4974 domain-containing protein [Mucilaginibacter sp. RS28]|uniref:DUF4974 domain-containing protein n=1 Tax=Mucilaginibacter straminoryzae TaxID=2932774 RepID=A0A9X1X1X4_9SPHI|nr:FecR family protein [Mucilaginibacter straminoryzae]MCJ8208850.1 DUF4974 domain-containing protein [Mucilaginibacter straminoryzae]
MDQIQSENLLKEESFINFCLEKNDNDVLYWQEWIKEHPESEPEIKKLRNLITSLSISSAQQQAQSQYVILQQSIKRPANIIYKLKIRRLSYYAAASFLIFALIGSYFLFTHKGTQNNYSANKKHDISPGGNKALLILANGKKIDLSDAKSGLIASEKGVSISKSADGQIVYKVNETSATRNEVTAVMNTIQTPAKGQFMVVLPDGTKVWLNAKTTFKYPSVFNQDVRQVELNGEAYFEVAHQNIPGTKKRVRFIVKTIVAGQADKDQYIEVLGTHFNVNCYEDEPSAITTLLEGSVKVSQPARNREAMLLPGQQLINGEGKFNVAEANTDAAIAWKNGDFVFHEDIRSALRKVARWYDVEISYQPGAPEHLMLGGWISRQNKLSEVLNLMEATGKVHLKLEGRRVLVTE